MTWIQTHTNQVFDLLDPQPDMVRLEDVAHALAHICRFTGHVPFYTVAQHSILVSEQVPHEHALQGLLHDAHEAYVGDVSKPLKMCPGMEGYQEIEARVWRVVAAHFGIDEVLHPSVKEADVRMLATEKRLFGKEPKPWAHGVKPYDFRLVPWDRSPNEIGAAFVARYQQLRG